MQINLNVLPFAGTSLLSSDTSFPQLLDLSLCGATVEKFAALPYHVSSRLSSDAAQKRPEKQLALR